MRTAETGVICYAGVSQTELWRMARQTLLQAGTAPPRLRMLPPLFPTQLLQPMPYLPQKADFSDDENDYHLQMSAECPELYDGDNRLRLFDAYDRFRGGVVTVDERWAARFAQYRPFMGERLCIYRIGTGHLAAAVPCSLWPRMLPMLKAWERMTHADDLGRAFRSYVRVRVSTGDRYDRLAFEADFLRRNGLTPVQVEQAQIDALLQDMSILAECRSGVRDDAALFTAEARRAASVAQYEPYRAACDVFVPEVVSRRTARLVQLSFEDGAAGDLWLPYEDVAACVDPVSRALDLRLLGDAFQLPPVYDPKTRGGRYPDHVRVAVVRDRAIELLAADCLNNPAYGTGLGPHGALCRRICLPHSRAHLRARRLMWQDDAFLCVNTRVDAEAYRRMCALARVQELKGRLIDAMYRRERALPLTDDTALRRRLDDRVRDLERDCDAAAQNAGFVQLSGYDADIIYLRRMAQSREAARAFAPDPARERSIEAGYAMRSTAHDFEPAGLVVEPEQLIHIPDPACAPDGVAQIRMAGIDAPEPAPPGAPTPDASTPASKRPRPPHHQQLSFLPRG